VADLDDILTTEEAARLLKVSGRTLERWRVRRRIPLRGVSETGSLGAHPLTSLGYPRVVEAARGEADS
jgi:hypothetical protein